LDADAENISALEACCTCGGGIRPDLNESNGTSAVDDSGSNDSVPIVNGTTDERGGVDASCENVAGWTDSQQMTCKAYEEEALLCSTAVLDADAENISALEACCTCGGGIRPDLNESNGTSAVDDSGSNDSLPIGFSVSPSIRNVMPTEAPNSGGYPVIVHLSDFLVVNGTEITFGDILLETVEHLILSNGQLAELSFQTPTTAPGAFNVTISAVPCQIPCSNRVRFLFTQRPSIQVVDQIPSRGPWQKGGKMSMDVVLRNLPRTTLFSDITIRFGLIVLNSSSVTFSNSELATVTVMVPPYSVDAVLDVLILICNGQFDETMLLKYHFFDGNALRTVALEPKFVPVSRLVWGSMVWLRPEVEVVIANFPDGLNVSSILVSSGKLEAQVTRLWDMNSCADGAVVDCRRTKFVLRLPAVESLGVRNITISTMQFEFVVGAIDYIEGCDFSQICGKSKVLDLLRVLATPVVTCDPNQCVDPNTLPPAGIMQVSSTQGLTLGGEVVRLHLLNFPFMHSSDISAVFKSARTMRIANVSFASIAVGSSLQASEAEIHIITPMMVHNDAETHAVTLFATFGRVQKEVNFVFEYLPLIRGPAVVNEFSPKTIRRTEELLLSIDLANIPRIEMPFNASEIRVRYADSESSAKEVLSSTRISTQVIISIAKPLQGWKEGLLRLKVYHIEQGMHRAASIDVIVVPTPPPKVISLFPRGGASEEETEVTLSIAYLEVEAEIMVGGGARILEATPTHDSACTERDCSSFELKLLLPALSGNLTLPATVQYEVVTGSVAASFSFRYARPDAPDVKLVSPTRQTLSEAGSVEILVLISNFPTASCMAIRSCAEEASSATVKFGSVAGVIKSLSNVDPNGLLDMRILAPSSVMQPSSVTVQVVQGEAVASFKYTYAIPPALVSPADAPVFGGLAATITAVGFPSPEVFEKACNLHISFGGIQASSFFVVTDEYGDESGRPHLKVAVSVPPFGSAGSVQGRMWLNCSIKFEYTDEIVANFDFEYFKPPEVLRLIPNRVAVNRQSVVDAIVQNFPLFSEIKHLQLQVGNHTCDGQVCAVRGFTHSAISTKVTIQVPSGLSEGTQMIRMEYTAPGEMNKCVKIAQAAVEYYRPLPTVLLARWCHDCNHGLSCVARGKCKNGVDPLKGVAKLSHSSSADNVVSIVLENAPDFTDLLDTAGLVKQDSNTDVLASFDGIVASLRRVVILNTHRLVLEVQVPPNITTAGKVLLVVTMHTPLAQPLTATTDFTFIDPKYVITSNQNDFPIVGAAAFFANVTNLPVGLFGAADEIEILFEDLSAKSFSVISHQAPSTLQLVIFPPDFPLSRSNGTMKAVFMSIFLRSDPSVSAQMQMFFWAPPAIMSAEFDGKGTSIVMHFDQPTDSAEMVIGDTDCAKILTQASLAVLGDGFECVWKSGSSMSIMLGRGATIVPGFEIGVQNLRSHNGVSSPSTAVTMVRACAEPIAPSISIDAPAVVDPCSSLRIRAMADSPRAVIYKWRCLDDVTLHQKLSLVAGPLLSLNSGTPEMPESDRAYTIAVTAVDFQNIESQEVRFSVYKKSSASPSVRFSPASLKTDTSEPVLVRADADFSSCPVRREAMTFTWRQLSGPSIDPVYLKPQAQLYIPNKALSPSSKYTVEVIVKMESDPSISSSGKFTFVVASLPLSARISSSKIEASTEKAFTLDGSDSKDLDLATESPQGLSFRWTCTLFDGSMIEQCRDTTGALLNLEEAAKVNIDKGMLAPTTDHPYTFTLTVSKGQKLPQSTSVSVVVLNRYVPTINVRTSTARVRSDGSKMINFREKVVLEGVCEDESASLDWFISPHVDMEDQDTFPMGRRGKSLVIAPGATVLQEGIIYTFTFSCESKGNTGTASLDLEVNSAPRGGRCSVCVASRSACSKTGAALVDRFVMACTNWAHVGPPDGPLEYQFGYEITSGLEAGNRLWFEKSERPEKDLRLPSGDITLIARVLDYYGASTEIVQEHVVVASASRRNEGRSKFDRVIDEITSRLQTQDMGGVNELTAAAAVEVSRSLPADAVSIIQTLVEKLLSAQSLAVVNSEYQCECLQAAHKVTLLAAIQSPQSLKKATHLMSRLAQAQSLGVIGESCAKFAIDIVGRALAHHQNQTTFGATFMSEMSSGLEQTISKFGATLANGERTAISSLSSEHTMIKLLLAEFDTRSFVFSSSSGVHRVWFPRGFSMATKHNLLHDPVVAYFRSHSRVPAMQNNLISVAPLVGLTLFKSDMRELTVAGLPSSILLTIPINTTGLSHVERENRKARLQCVYWDGTKGFYTGSGCSIVGSNDSWAQCACDHLTEITVVDNPSIVPCGDGVKHPGEACDDGNVLDCDGCNSRCEIENMTSLECMKQDAPVKDNTYFFVTFQVNLRMTVIDFSTDKQLSFRRAIAAAVGVDLAQVTIQEIEISARRSKSIEIHVSIAADDGSLALLIVSRLTLENINIQLSTVFILRLRQSTKTLFHLRVHTLLKAL
jgi:cysteine-rich repeat protein